MTETKLWQSRAVIRLVEAGSLAVCAHCEERVMFKARLKLKQIICNVYKDERWTGVEHYHPECYDMISQPYGAPAD